MDSQAVLKPLKNLRCISREIIIALVMENSMWGYL